MYLLTKKLYINRKILNPNKANDSRSIDSTIINRAYYSPYSLLWLMENKDINFRLKDYFEFSPNETFYTKHEQVKNELKDYGKLNSKNKLKNLHILRKKADYSLFYPITDKDLNYAIELMEFIVNDLITDL